MNDKTTRREVIKGLTLGAGATLLTPILSQLTAHAAGNDKVLPRRFVFVLQSNGLNPDYLVPKGHKRGNTTRNLSAQEITQVKDSFEIALAGKELSPAMEPLTPFAERLTLLQGLSGCVAKSDHSSNHGALGSYSAKKVEGQTIDSALAEALPGVFPHVLVGLDGNGDAMNYAHSAIGPNIPLPTICSPDLAFRSLFGSVEGGSSKATFDRTTNLLDFMADDVRRSRAALAGEEREKLDRYAASFEALHKRQVQIAAMQENLKKHAPQLGEKRTTTTSSLILEAQFEIATAALISGLTNVVTITSGSGGQRFGKYPEFGVTDQHTLGHGGTFPGKSNAEWFIFLHQIHTKQIANMAARLDAIPEGNGTMLDNTLIVFLSDSGEAHHPSLRTWPVVLLGNLGGRLKPGGRYLELPSYGESKHRTLASLYCTLLHAAGKPRDKFGTDDVQIKDVKQTGPIGELLA